MGIYGLSSEGYQIASKLAAKGYEVFIVDETLGTAMLLRPEVASDYRELWMLLAAEPLLPVRPTRESISNSKVIFFTPKLRKNEDLMTEVKTRVIELAKSLASGTLLVFCSPLGIGGSKEIIERVEHVSGLVNGKDFSFAYAPLDSGKPVVFGSEGELGDHFSIIEAAGFSMELFAIPKAELVHAQHTITRYSSLGSNLEVAKRLTQMGFESPREYRQIYADDLSFSLCDLRLVVESLEPGDPLLYLATGSVRSVESYTKFLVERIRELVRLKDLKASRLRILLFTDTDRLEIRGDRLSMANLIQEKLRDFYTDIEYLNMMKEGFTPTMGMEKINLLIFLSGSSEQKLLELYEDQISMTRSYMIRANLPVEFVEGAQK